MIDPFAIEEENFDEHNKFDNDGFSQGYPFLNQINNPDNDMTYVNDLDNQQINFSNVKDDFNLEKENKFFSSIIKENFKTDAKTNNNNYYNKLIAKKRGRIPSRSEIKKFKKHDKFSNDNMKRKLKRILFERLREFTNYKIKFYFENKNYKGIFAKKILINQKEQTFNVTRDYDRKLFKKTLGEILSYNVTRRNKVQIKHNKNLIESLMNHENEEIKKYFNNLFNLTLFDCLKHFRGTEENVYLKGLTTFEEIKKDILNEPDYIEKLSNLLTNYEKNINL